MDSGDVHDYRSMEFLLSHLKETDNYYTHFANKESVWTNASIDSRTVKSSTLFFGLKGDRENGGLYLLEVVENNANIAVIDVEAFTSFFSRYNSVDPQYESIAHICSMAGKHKGVARPSDVMKETASKMHKEDSSRLQFGAFLEQESDAYQYCKKIVYNVVPHDFSVVVVHDSFQALRTLAKTVLFLHRKNMTIIGITGSMGKTTTKNMLQHILQNFAGTVFTKGNFNTPQGLALSFLNSEWDDAEYAVYECGISECGEMDVLSDMLKPDIAVITNVGSAHMGGFSTIDELREEKLKIAQHSDYTKFLFLPQDDPALISLARKYSHTKLVLFGGQQFKTALKIQDNALEGLTVQYSNGEKESDLVLHKEAPKDTNGMKQEKNYVFNIIGAVNKRNIYLCMALVQHLQLSVKKSVVALKSFTNMPQRYEIRCKKPLIIDDSYNANFEAMQHTLDWFGTLQFKHKVAVLGGMKELGSQSRKFHFKLIQFVNTLDFSLVLWVGREYEEFRDRVMNYFPSVEGIEDFLLAHVRDDSALIFKGSNSYNLSSVVDTFLHKRETQVLV